MSSASAYAWICCCCMDLLHLHMHGFVASAYAWICHSRDKVMSSAFAYVLNIYGYICMLLVCLLSQPASGAPPKGGRIQMWKARNTRGIVSEQESALRQGSLSSERPQRG